MRLSRLTHEIRIVLRVVWLCTLVVSVFTLAAHSAFAQEKNATGYYYPTGSSNFGGYLGWLRYNSTYYPWHLAQDMKSKYNDPVYAVDDGIVVLSNSSVGGYGGVDKNNRLLSGGGFIVKHITRSGQTFYSLYGHIKADTLPAINTKVTAGQIIARVGHYWYSDGSDVAHVHNAIMPNKLPNNPWAGYTSNKHGDQLGFVNPWHDATIDGHFYPGFFDRNQPSGSSVSGLDINGDGSPDIGFQDRSTGRVWAYYMSGANLISCPATSIGTADPNWVVCGMPDINQDGHPDVVLRNTATGEISCWYLNGLTRTGSPVTGLIGITSSEYVVCGFADFNGDSYPDIVFRNIYNGGISVWYLNNGVKIGGSGIEYTTSEWTVCGFPDLNKDGHPDIVLRSNKTHWITVWYLNGPTRIGSPAGPLGQTSSEWDICGFPDLNKDGQPDIVFRSKWTGALSYWYLDGPYFSKGPDHSICSIPSNVAVIPMY